MLDAIGLLVALLFGQPGAAESWLSHGVTFRPRERAVSDWRWEAATNLDASPGARATLLLGRDPAAVTRCVRLNNYWCIKRGGWSGEIAADADGHVAFASAAEGATVAALLLRRYYVDGGRHSAMAIVSHWAPASCAGLPVAGRGGSPRAGPGGAATRGIGRTLRARWLASHGHRVAAVGRGRTRASAVPDRLIGTATPAPVIALGLGTAPVGISAALPDILARGPGPALPSVPACAGDAVRIAAYAARAAAGIATTVNADLALFDAAGEPTPHLGRLMRNMAAVEVGPLGAGERLVETAVAHAAEVVAARRAAAAGAPPRPGIDEARRPEPHP